MSTEIEVYAVSRDYQTETKLEADKPLSLRPGESYHIPNINFHDGSEEVYVVRCLEDNKMTIVYKMANVVEFQGVNAPMILYNKDEVENRARKLKSGESKDYSIRQRVEGKITNARFNITHK